jgi:hypothetical protein
VWRVTRQDKTIDPRIITYTCWLLYISVAVAIDEDNTHNNNIHDKVDKLEKKTRAYAGGVYLKINLTHTTHTMLGVKGQGQCKCKTQNGSCTAKGLDGEQDGSCKIWILKIQLCEKTRKGLYFGLVLLVPKTKPKPNSNPNPNPNSNPNPNP